MDADARQSFGSLLKAHRLARGLSQTALAERSDLSRDAIGLLERGLRHSPRRDTVTLLAEALKLSLEDRARLLAAASEPHHGAIGGTTFRPGPSSSLPLRLTSFIGREQEIAEVQALVRSKRLVTLCGPGGIGKTSLALAVAARMQTQFTDGVSLVDLVGLTDGELMSNGVAAVLGVRERAREPILTTLATVLGMTQRLLVLDNCEHLLLSCARTVEALLQRCPRLRILVTSREPLRVGAEVVWRVPALTLPDDDAQPLDVLATSEAVRLFVERAEAVRSGFELSAENAAAVAEICRRLDGIPLAIELAAARVSALTPEQIARHLTDRFRLLTTGSRTAVPRHQTLRALVDWSYDLLGEPERALFRRLAVFAGGWTLEAAEAVGAGNGIAVEDIVAMLSRLVDQSLVVLERDEDGADRYRLLETMREYTRERLVERGEADSPRKAHASFFLTLAEQQTTTTWDQWDHRYWNRLEVEHDNLRAALQWFAEHAEVERSLRLSSALAAFWAGRGYLTEGQRFLDEQLGRRDAVAPQVQATALETAGRLAFTRGDLEVAATYARESVAIWRQLSDRRRLADALDLLGMIARDQCSYPEALAALQGSRQLLQESDDPRSVAASLFQLGLLARQQADDAGAQSLLEEALAIQQTGDYPRDIGATLLNLGMVAEDQGDYVRAHSLYEESVGLMQQVNDRWHLAFLLEAFASLAIARGLLRRGALLAGAARTLRRQIGSAVPPSIQPRVDRTLRLARGGLGEDAFGQVWGEGRTMTLDQAIAYALKEDDP